jgi:hypothetical protein
MFITLQELAEYSGYSIHTLKMFIVDGLLPQCRGRRNHTGIYPIRAKEIIDKYKNLKQQGLKRSDIIASLPKEDNNV